MSKQELVQAEPVGQVQEIKQSQAVDPMQLISVAVQQGADISQLEKLMDLQERYQKQQAVLEFNEAMSRFQLEMPVVPKRGNVDYTTSKGRTNYDYGQLDDAVKIAAPLLAKYGLSYRWNQKQENGQIIVKFIVTHKSGHAESNQLSAMPDQSGGKDSIKAAASTVSYLRRYTFSGGLGIVFGGEDDEMVNQALGCGVATQEQIDIIEAFYNSLEQSKAERFWNYVNSKVKVINTFNDLNSTEAAKVIARIGAK